MASKTIDEAYRAVNPDQPLIEGARDIRYVNCSEARGGEDEVKLMTQRIRRSMAPNYSKQLFTGHRGCGKTTELFRLKHMLEREHYFVVYFDVESELDISDLDYPDVLLTIAQQVEKQARNRLRLQLKQELLADIARWFEETVVTRQQGRETTLAAEVGVFAPLLGKIKGEIKHSDQRRAEIRPRLERNATQLIQHVNGLIDDVQVCLKQSLLPRGLVLIIDGLEKLIYRVFEGGRRSSHDLLFIDHGEQLLAPNCHIVFTVPINLLFNQNVGQIFTENTILPMIKIHEEDGSQCEAGIEALHSIISQRVEISEIFDSPSLVHDLVMTSGGHVRDLLRLVRYVFDYADTTVNVDHIHRAIRKLVREYDYLVQNDDLPRLHHIHGTRRVMSDEPHALLLHKLLVLEYCNHERWADVHPAVQATRKFKESVQS